MPPPIGGAARVTLPPPCGLSPLKMKVGGAPVAPPRCLRRNWNCWLPRKAGADCLPAARLLPGLYQAAREPVAREPAAASVGWWSLAQLRFASCVRCATVRREPPDRAPGPDGGAAGRLSRGLSVQGCLRAWRSPVRACRRQPEALPVTLAARAPDTAARAMVLSSVASRGRGGAFIAVFIICAILYPACEIDAAQGNLGIIDFRFSILRNEAIRVACCVLRVACCVLRVACSYEMRQILFRGFCETKPFVLPPSPLSPFPIRENGAAVLTREGGTARYFGLVPSHYRGRVLGPATISNRYEAGAALLCAFLRNEAIWVWLTSRRRSRRRSHHLRSRRRLRPNHRRHRDADRLHPNHRRHRRYR